VVDGPRERPRLQSATKNSGGYPRAMSVRSATSRQKMMTSSSQIGAFASIPTAKEEQPEQLPTFGVNVKSFMKDYF